MGYSCKLEQELAEAKKYIADLEANVERFRSDRDAAQMRIDEKDKRIAALEAALRKIAEHPHCDDDAMPEPPFYSDVYDRSNWMEGHIDGHRCAAEIARKAREGKP